jgi:hypothetical protein
MKVSITANEFYGSTHKKDEKNFNTCKDAIEYLREIDEYGIPPYHTNASGRNSAFMSGLDKIDRAFSTIKIDIRINLTSATNITISECLNVLSSLNS